MANEYHYGTGAAQWDDPCVWPAALEILRRLEPPPNRVFEIGFGNGGFAEALSGAGYEITGVEDSLSGIERAKKRCPTGTFQHGSAYEDLRSRFGQFRVVIALEVVEHLYAPRELVQRAFDLLEPGGLLVLSTPFHGYAKNLLIALAARNDRHFDPLWDHGHIKFFSERTLRTLLDESGLASLEISKIGRIPPFARSMIATARRPASAGAGPESR